MACGMGVSILCCSIATQLLLCAAQQLAVHAAVHHILEDACMVKLIRREGAAAIAAAEKLVCTPSRAHAVWLGHEVATSWHACVLVVLTC